MPPTNHQNALPTPRLCPWRSASTSPWEVIFPRLPGEKRPTRKYFRTEADGQKAVDDWSRGRKAESTITVRDADIIRQCRALLPEGVTLLDTVRFYIENHTSLSSVSFGDAVELYRRRLLKKSETYIEVVGRELDLAVEFFGKDTPCGTLTKQKLVAYILDGKSHWIQYGRRRALSAVFGNAVQRGTLKENPLDGVQIDEKNNTKVHFMSLQDIQAIMDDAAIHAPDLAPVFALQIWAGIRTEELGRPDDTKKQRHALRWQDLRWGKQIVVEAESAKMNAASFINYWPESLTSFLSPYKKDVGRIWTQTSCSLKQAKAHYFRSLNIRRKDKGLPPVDYQQNDFRHSYGTYLCNYFEDAGKVQLLMRQRDKDVFYTNYFGKLEDPALGKAFVEMKPTQPAPGQAVA